MSQSNHFVRFGVLGHVGRFSTPDSARYPRGCQVVLETERGLEVGVVLRSVDMMDQPEIPAEAVNNGQDRWPNGDGVILRALTAADRLLMERLDRYRLRATRACEAMLQQRGIPAALIDVEHLFDGESLFFYFLGEVTAELNALTSELAAAYDTEVQFKQFAKTLTEGCGPDCGTQEGECGDGGCSSCAVATACASADKLDTAVKP